MTPAEYGNAIFGAGLLFTIGGMIVSVAASYAVTQSTVKNLHKEQGAWNEKLESVKNNSVSREVLELTMKNVNLQYDNLKTQMSQILETQKQTRDEMLHILRGEP